jgi:CheY-like chemotaxis protein
VCEVKTAEVTPKLAAAAFSSTHLATALRSTGRGLASARHACTYFDEGSLDLVGEAGGWTNVTFSLPADAPVEVVIPTQREFKALVIDDDEFVLSIMSKMVNDMDGCKECATLHHTLSTAVTDIAAQADASDLLLLDHNLAGDWTSDKVAARLRTEHAYGGLIIVNTGASVTQMHILRDTCPYIDGVVSKGLNQVKELRAIVNRGADWIPDAPGVAECRHKVLTSQEMLNDLLGAQEDVRARAHQHKAVCVYAGACPVLVKAFDDVKQAPDETLLHYMSRALTVLLQTRRAASLQS